MGAGRRSDAARSGSELSLTWRSSQQLHILCNHRGAAAALCADLRLRRGVGSGGGARVTAQATATALAQAS